ncbi:MAG TPA: UDP-N-acetylmuramoyl-tripeptide--D-alanyl-D-alanine ligase [Candidatus Paceibacterota bacterium]|nr:UDP-N-acetylmuramoyl-tripeptide--D-alanyl-D-alanine ligase [Candidatus Paceibacterota bacterium]
MKRILKPVFAFMLGLFARGVVRKYRPRIVMVTGSVGKTSTKDAIATVLGERFLARKSEKSFNSEFGVPFTILGVGNPWGNPFAWASVIKNGLTLLLLPNHYPNLLVLEVGADRPGDLARILRIATPDAVVVTRLPDIPVHVEAYTSPEAVREEEFSPAYALAPAAPLVVSADDSHARRMAARLPVRLITYGMAEDATIRVSDIDFYQSDGRVAGMQARATVAGESVSLVVKGSVGKAQIPSTAAALAAALAFDIPLAEAAAALAGYVPPRGRGRILRGKNGSLIIDDSYNSSPAAVEIILATLKAFPHAKRRIAVLGDMLELGRYSVAEHERIGALARASADLVIAVGIRARAFVSQDEIGAMRFDDSRRAAVELSELAQKGDVILVKGSQSVRMERIVEALLVDPADVVHLVRQDKEWKRRA